MTTVSEIDEVYVYFSMTEKELLAMTKSGSTIKEEISKIPTIKLQLIDGSTYDIEGKVDATQALSTIYRFGKHPCYLPE